MNILLSKTDNKILRLLKILLGLCLVVPLFVSSGLLFPYTSAKAFAFRILIEIAAVFYFYLVLKKSPLIAPPFKKGGLGGILTLAVMAFLLVAFLSAIFGADFNSSFWGNLERMIGVWGLAHFILFFLMLISVFKDEKSWLNLIKISIGASTLVSLLAIIQRFASIGLLIPQVDRVFSTIGNAGFFGTYLIFNIFFAGYFLARSILAYPSTKPRSAGLRSGNSNKNLLPERIRQQAEESKAPALIYGGVALIQLVALIFTQTRGAWLGLFAGLVFALVSLVVSKLFARWRKYSLAILILIFLAVGFIFAFRQSDYMQNNSLLRRLSSISLKDTTTQNRLILWSASWRAWQEKPFFGWGYENYETAINKYFDPRLNPYEAWYDRAHNFIFDYGAQSGWLGFIAYLGLFAAAFYCLKKRSDTNIVIPAEAGIQKSGFRVKPGMTTVVADNSYIAVIFGSLLISYLVQNLFVFDSFISYLMLFFILAVISGFSPSFEKEPAPYLIREGAGRISNNTVSNPPQPPFVKGGKTSLNLLGKFLLLVLIIFVVFSIYVFNLKPISASKLGSRILSLPPEEAGQAAPLLEKVIALETFAAPEIIYQATIDYLAKARELPELTENENFYRLMSSRLASFIEKSPEQVRYRVALAWLNLYFSDADSFRADQAIEQANEIKKFSPAKKDSYQILVAAYFIKGDSRKIEEQIKEARQLSPVLGKDVEEFWQGLSK